MADKRVPKYTWWVEICEEERALIVFPSAEAVLEFAKGNNPVTIGTIDVPMRTNVRLKKEFRNPDVGATSVSWKRYAPQLGYDEVPRG